MFSESFNHLHFLTILKEKQKTVSVTSIPEQVSDAAIIESAIVGSTATKCLA